MHGPCEHPDAFPMGWSWLQAEPVPGRLLGLAIRGCKQRKKSKNHSSGATTLLRKYKKKSGSFQGRGPCGGWELQRG